MGRKFFRGAMVFAGAVLICLLIVVTGAESGYAEEQGAVKRVKCAVNGSGPFALQDKSGVIIGGYAYDFIEKIAAYSAWNIEYVNYTGVDACREALKNGEVDAFYEVSRAPGQENKMIYPDYAVGTEGFRFFCLPANEHFGDSGIEALRDKRIGVTAGTVQAGFIKDWCDRKRLNCRVTAYESTQAKKAALTNGEIAFDCEIDVVSCNDYLSVITIGESDFCLAFNQQRGDLAADYNRALRQFSEYNPYFIANVNMKYFTSSTVSSYLSQMEQDYLKSHKVIRIGCMKKYLPFSDLTADGEVIGLVKDLMPLLFEALNIQNDVKAEFVVYNDGEEMYKALREDRVDVIFPILGSIAQAKDNGVIFSSGIADASVDLAYKGAYTDNTVKSLAVNRNNWMMEHHTKLLYPQAKIIYYDTIEKCVEAVRAGAVGGVLLNSFRSDAILRKAGDKSLRTMKLNETVTICFAFKAGNTAPFFLFNRALANVNYGTIASMAYMQMNKTAAVSGWDLLREKWQYALGISVLSIFFLVAAVYYRRNNIIMAKDKDKIERQKLELEKANNAKTEFLFNMSHDIRTPMNAIIGYTKLLEAGIDDREQAQENLKKIRSASSHLLGLINDILEMSRIEAGKFEIREEVIDIRRAVESVEQMSLALASGKDISFELQMSEIVNPYIYADELHVNEMLINIISNAVKYTNPGGRVVYSVEQLGGEQEGKVGFRFTVADTGIGMSEEFQRHLFEPFSRERTSTVSRTEGTGLGLSIVKKIVDLIGGAIGIKSRQGEGTTVTIEMAFRIADGKEAEALRQKAVEAVNTEKRDFSGKRVLLVEDNEMNREIAGMILSEAGLVVEEAEDGSIAVRLLKEKGLDYYEAILMDIQMPVIDGYTATKEIRSMLGGRTIPIIAVSANAFAEDKAASLAAGMNDHIAKPIEIDELFGVLAKYM